MWKMLWKRTCSVWCAIGPGIRSPLASCYLTSFACFSYSTLLRLCRTLQGTAQEARLHPTRGCCRFFVEGRAKVVDVGAL